MANYVVSGADLTAVADAIRSKSGTDAALVFPVGFVGAIGEIIGSGDYVTAVFGEVTPASDAVYLNIPVTGLTTIVGTFGTTKKTEWDAYNKNPDYDNCNTMWIGHRSKATWWACNAADQFYQGIFLSGNANGHSYKSSGVVYTNPTNVRIGYSGYKFKAGWTYHYIVFGVK